MNSANRIIANSSILYLKTITTVIVSIFTSRYVLDGLGVVDYGIMNLVGGVVGMLGFITATLSNTGTRFIANSLGQPDLEITRGVFRSVLNVTSRAVFLIIILLELVGLIMINNVLKIPDDRIMTANVVFQFMVFNSAYNLMTAPYYGLLFSREKIVFISLVDIANLLFKVIIVIIMYNSALDRLLLYTALLFLLSFFHRSFLKWYCSKTDEITQKIDFIGNDDKLRTWNKELIEFSGWNLLGSIGIIVTRQGRIMLVNYFFGIIMNATLGIATVVNNQLSNFSSSLLRAIQPQVFKSFGGTDKRRQEFLTFITSKIGIILISIFAVPLFIETDYILGVWLIDVPDLSALFIRFGLILTVLGHMSYGLTISIQGHGQVKELQLTSFILQSLNFPITYLLYKLGYQIYYTFVAAIVIEVIIFCFRLYFARKILNLPVKKFVTNIVFLPLLMLFFLLIVGEFITSYLDPSVFRLSTIIVLNLAMVCVYSYSFILDEKERAIVNRVAVDIRRRLTKVKV